MRRPLTLPTVKADDPCPRTAGQRIARIEGTVLGDGPVYIQGPGADEVVYLGDGPMAGDHRAIPLRWVMSPGQVGPILIRGRALDGSDGLRFGIEDPQPELPVWQRINAETRDWMVWRRTADDIAVPGPGCYAVQIDGLDFSQVIVFEVVAGAAPGDKATQL